MQWRTTISDAEFIRRVERYHKHRWRAILIMMIVIPSIWVGLGVYIYQVVQSGPAPLISGESPIPFQQGATIGLIYGCIFCNSLFYPIAGLYWILAGRKDRVLLDYHRRLFELGEFDE